MGLDYGVDFGLVEYRKAAHKAYLLHDQNCCKCVYYRFYQPAYERGGEIGYADQPCQHHEVDAARAGEKHGYPSHGRRVKYNRKCDDEHAYKAERNVDAWNEYTCPAQHKHQW